MQWKIQIYGKTAITLTFVINPLTRLELPALFHGDICSRLSSAVPGAKGVAPPLVNGLPPKLFPSGSLPLTLNQAVYKVSGRAFLIAIRTHVQVPNWQVIDLAVVGRCCL